ncbi:MAG: hypothetical protein OEV42_21105 [Deltaproteobacteria bacterium]|nr:hypothetical protein [Deltaproteobacteria bacterium]
MRSEENKELNEIVEYLELKKSIPKDKLLQWMVSSDIEVLGLTSIIFDQFKDLIKSFPPIKITLEFYQNYFCRCIRENPHGEYSESRYIAANSFSRFYKALRHDKKIEKELLKEFRDILKKLYLEGDDDIRECIINGALEHLFEDDEIVNEFETWKNDNTLKKAYKLALEWGKAAP